MKHDLHASHAQTVSTSSHLINHAAEAPVAERLASLSQSVGPYMPHGHCYLWQPGLVGSMVISDLAIGISYTIISYALYRLIRQIKLPFSSMFLAFGVFIFACGLTHFMEVYTLWVPNYWASAILKIITAIASVTVAFLMAPIAPKIRDLAQAVRLSQSRKEELEGAYREMERRVEDRTQELRLVNEALISSENKFSLTVQHAAIGVSHIDKNGKWTMANPWIAKILGYSQEELLNKTIFEVTFPEDLPLSHVMMDKAIRGEVDSYQEEKRYIRKDGSIIWILRNVSVVRTEQGLFDYIISVVQDITERKEAVEARQQAEHQARQTNDKIRLITDLMPQMVWTTTEDGTHTYFNQRWEDYTGLTLAESHGWGWQDVLHPDDVQRTTVIWNESLKTGRDYEIKYRMKSKNGTYRWFLGRAKCSRDERGSITSWFGTCTDIDDQVRAENTLKLSQDMLEQEVEKRTSELRVANSQLQVANEELEAFAYSVSHDLRAPLRGIDGFSVALLEDYSTVIDSSGQKYLQFIREGIQKMGVLIDDLLRLSRVTRTDIKKSSVDLTAAALHIGERIRLEGEYANSEFFVEPDLRASVDPGLFNSVLENLISNAFKFSARSHPPQIYFGKKEENGRTIFYVRDNGVGFEMEFKDKLFGVFQRLHAQTDFKGTGVGLAIVKRIIEKHGGEVWAHSELGQGTTLFFTL